MKIKNKLLERSKKKIKNMELKGIQLFPNNFQVKNTVKEINKYLKNKKILETPSLNNKNEFVIAGRIISINNFGKSSFAKIKDITGTIQIYIKKDKTKENSYELFKLLDIGDFIGTSGNLFKTKTGEITIFSKKIKLLSKSIRFLPEKFHGLKDPEKRYRYRYLDLIMNSNTKKIFKIRSKIIQIIRSFFLKKDYLEVETPIMHPIPGGADAKPFKTYHESLNMNLFLRIAPELYLKRLVIGGFERVFEINKSFRNEGISSQHNPEFTMLEFYQSYTTYEDLMKLTEKMFTQIALLINGSTVINYQNKEINLGTPWKKITMLDALENIGKIKKSTLKNKKELINFAESKNIKIDKNYSLGKILTKVFENIIEPKLIQPTFITQYPVEVSPLSRRNEINNHLTDRFELYLSGFEIANGFSELNDPRDQKKRFLEQKKNKSPKDINNFVDFDYVTAMEYGMPPTAGEGIGIDRLVMIFTNSPSIREVILFPHLKTKQINL